jgi:hypothetical protein
MQRRVDRHGMLGPYGVRYSWVYWAASAAGLAFLIVDLFDDGALWNLGVVVSVIIAIAVRPGGIRGPARRGGGGRTCAARPATPLSVGQASG